MKTFVVTIGASYEGDMIRCIQDSRFETSEEVEKFIIENRTSDGEVRFERGTLSQCDYSFDVMTIDDWIENRIWE